METTVTQGNVKILKYFNISEKLPYHKGTVGWHTGVDILCDKVYSPFPGTVVYIGKDMQKHYTVIIQYNQTHAVAFQNMKSLVVKSGEIVDSYHEVGAPDEFVHVEYLSTENPNRFKVMLTGQTFYKHDPIDLLLNGYESWLDYGSEVSMTQSLLQNVTFDEVDDGN